MSAQHLAMVRSNLRSILNLCQPKGEAISPVDAHNVRHEATHALSLLDAHEGEPSPDGRDALTQQQVCDRFGFMEGLVTEATYRRITDEAFRIRQEALAASQPVGKEPGRFVVVAYQQITPNDDDPEVMDAKLWALPPGYPVPEGCTPLYWWTGEGAPPAQGVQFYPDVHSFSTGYERARERAAEELATLERYDHVMRENPWPYSDMDRVNDGDWVRYRHVKKMLKELGK